MAFSHNSEYLVVGSDTETVHLFRCSTMPMKSAQGQGQGLAQGRPGSGRAWSAGSASPTTESPVGDNMDAVIEQKRRNGSMGYGYLSKYHC